MGVRGCTFPEAIGYLVGGRPLAGPSRRPGAATRPTPSAPAGHVGMAPEAAAALIAESVERLWSPGGAQTLAYLMGPDRHLSPGTIRAARLGYADRVEARSAEGHTYTASGIVIPWFTADAPALVKVRQPRGRRPKYAEVFRDRSRWSGLYPGPESIRPGLPLVIVEGEFDALCLGQELSDLAPVVTLGSASARPDRAILGRMLPSAPWFIATDRDAAGDESARAWPASARRVRPPGSFKDWTEAKAGGVHLDRWWRDILAGMRDPPPFTWDELSRQRWGPAERDPTPGIIVP